MSLVTSKDLATATGLYKFGFIGTFVGWIILKITRISRVNRFYNKHKHLEGVAFLDAVIEDLNLQYDLPVEDLKKIPLTGSFITISNHPLGGVDGIILLKLILKIRPDFKVMANFLLSRIQPLAPYFIQVNPFEEHRDVKSSIEGFKLALKHIEGGGCLGIFPAGEVSTHRNNEKRIVDKDWEKPAMKLIRKANTTVIPVYFHARNSIFFYRIARLGSSFRTAALASEIFTQSLRKIKIRIGNPIAVKQQEEYKSLEIFTETLRKKTYMLSNALRKNRFKVSIPNKISIKSPEQIVDSVASDLLEQEVLQLKKNDKTLLKSSQYEVFLADANEIPNLLQEIGRQREETFRAIGEGTNKAIDLDVFDTYYKHLFLWDNDAKKIVGAYRMGLGSEIFPTYGIQGFYLYQLFRFESELYPMMEKTIEMGRAYICKEYQQKPMPLFLLWRGIIHTTLRYPEHKYLMGGVSISNQFSKFSKSLMIEFMKSNYWDPYIAQYIRPKKEFKVKLTDADKDFVFDETKADLNKFDKLINEVEPGNLRLPVLIKKYIKQNARVVAFNVDPLFNDAIDGLMYIATADIPESTIKPVMEEFQAEIERKQKEGAKA